METACRDLGWDHVTPPRCSHSLGKSCPCFASQSLQRQESPPPPNIMATAAGKPGMAGEDTAATSAVPSRQAPLPGAPLPPRPSVPSAAATEAPARRSVNDFEIGRELGEGSYSTVHLAVEKATGKEFAIKVLSKRHIIKENKVKYVEIEKKVLNRLRHPFVISLYYTFQDACSLYFVLELVKNGDMLAYIKKLGCLHIDAARFYIAEIVAAVDYMHSKGIIHRDLKPENILLGDDGHIRVTDFGTAKILDNTGECDSSASARANSFVGTAEYVSPELLTDKAASQSSDLWAIGCLLFQLLAGKPPFKGSNEYQTFQKIIKLEYTIPEGFPVKAEDLVKKLLVSDPAARLGAGAGGFTELKAHPFFNGIDWVNLATQEPPKLVP